MYSILLRWHQRVLTGWYCLSSLDTAPCSAAHFEQIWLLSLLSLLDYISSRSRIAFTIEGEHVHGLLWMLSQDQCFFPLCWGELVIKGFSLLSHQSTSKEWSSLQFNDMWQQHVHSSPNHVQLTKFSVFPILTKPQAASLIAFTFVSSHSSTEQSCFFSPSTASWTFIPMKPWTFFFVDQA